MIIFLNLSDSYKALCTRMHTQHIYVMTVRGRSDWIDNPPLASSDTSFYLSKCASLLSSRATWGLFANFVGYLV